MSRNDNNIYKGVLCDESEQTVCNLRMKDSESVHIILVKCKKCEEQHYSCTNDYCVHLKQLKLIKHSHLCDSYLDYRQTCSVKNIVKQCCQES